MRLLVAFGVLAFVALQIFSAYAARQVRRDFAAIRLEEPSMAIISKFTLRDPELDNAEDPVLEVSRTLGEEAAVWLAAIAAQVASMPLCTTWQTRINGKLYDAKVTTICQDETQTECETRHENEVNALKQIYEEE